MSDRLALARELSEHASWVEFMVPELKQSREYALEEALISRDMEELSRNQGWIACLEWIQGVVEDLANEHKEQNPDE